MPSQMASAPRPLALIEDDDADTREMYSIHLSGHGMGVVEARGGEDAIEIAKDVPSRCHHERSGIGRFRRHDPVPASQGLACHERHPGDRGHRPGYASRGNGRPRRRMRVGATQTVLTGNAADRNQTRVERLADTLPNRTSLVTRVQNWETRPITARPVAHGLRRDAAIYRILPT